MPKAKKKSKAKAPKVKVTWPEAKLHKPEKSVLREDKNPHDYDSLAADRSLVREVEALREVNRLLGEQVEACMNAGADPSYARRADDAERTLKNIAQEQTRVVRLMEERVQLAEEKFATADAHNKKRVEYDRFEAPRNSLLAKVVDAAREYRKRRRLEFKIANSHTLVPHELELPLFGAVDALDSYGHWHFRDANPADAGKEEPSVVTESTGAKMKQMETDALDQLKGAIPFLRGVVKEDGRYVVKEANEGATLAPMSNACDQLSDGAMAASKLAGATHAPEAHSAASQAHQAAFVAAQANSRPSLAQHHLQKAAEHDKMADATTPEGKGALAHRATVHARNEGTPKAHKDAADAHGDAQAAYEAAGDNRNASLHSSRKFNHMESAQRLAPKPAPDQEGPKYSQ